MLITNVEVGLSFSSKTHGKVEKPFLLFGISIRHVFHISLFEIIGKKQGVQS